jgi:hypothetical protein
MEERLNSEEEEQHPEHGADDDDNVGEAPTLPQPSHPDNHDALDWKSNDERRKRREERFGSVGEVQKAALAAVRSQPIKEAPRKRYKINEAAMNMVEHAESIELTEEVRYGGESLPAHLIFICLCFSSLPYAFHKCFHCLTLASIFRI